MMPVDETLKHGTALVPHKHAVGTVTVGEDHEMDLMENDRWYGGKWGAIEVERRHLISLLKHCEIYLIIFLNILEYLVSTPRRQSTASRPLVSAVK